MNFDRLKKYLFIALIAGSPIYGTAQAPKISEATPLAHDLKHNDLLTDQINIIKEINLLDSVAYRYKLQEETEQFPAIDLYTTWDSRYVNPYKNMAIQIPDSFKINLISYRMPVLKEEIKLTDEFGYRKRRRRFHYGVDIKVQVGDTIYATFDGTVRLTRYERGYGYHVVLRHQNGLETIYGHLSKFLVKPDQVIKVGDPIALGGNTGRSSGSHLHFETRFLGVAIDPAKIFDFINQAPHQDYYVFNNPKNTIKQTVGSNLAHNSTAAKQAATAKTSASADGPAFHSVRSGDTLGALAVKYRTSITNLCRLNGISKTTTLNLKQKIRYK